MANPTQVTAQNMSQRECEYSMMALLLIFLLDGNFIIRNIIKHWHNILAKHCQLFLCILISEVSFVLKGKSQTEVSNMATKI